MTAPGVIVEGATSLAGRAFFGPLRLELAPGRWTGLLGASGVGKSTLLRLIAGLGTGAAFEGRVAASDGLPLAGRIALMGQQDMLLPWADVLGNVMLGARLRGEARDTDRARKMIARVGLSGQAGHRPHMLSGGQRQRAALARTLMEDRPVVLLDEPFSALDARNRAGMQDLAAEVLQGRTVLLVTHDPLEAVRMSHHAFLMRGGALHPLPLPTAPPVRAIDDAATLRAQADLFQHLLGAA